jgi:predicted histone-like DNA-binding protein
MGMKVKAIERKLKFSKEKDALEEYRYVLQPEFYGRLPQAKVVHEAALHSGISKGAINAAWEAIGDVIKAWATEGHSVAIPGLGSMRFGLRSKSVTKVEDVSSDLITSRRVIFVPNTEIKQELAKTSVAITCYDRNRLMVKQVTSADDGEVEDPDSDDPDGGSADNAESQP